MKSKYSTTTEVPLRRGRVPLASPGEILRLEFLEPMGITAYRLAKETGMPAIRVKEILDGKRAITADTALRLAKFFGADAQSWMNMQAHYDLLRAQESKSTAEALSRIVPVQLSAHEPVATYARRGTNAHKNRR
jgi:addiction module HigA family antidote